MGRTEIARLKFPIGSYLLCDFLRAATRNPPVGFDGSDIRVGETDADGWTPIFAEKDGNNPGRETF